MCAKTFGKDITKLEEMQEAVATYAARAAEKLREQDSLASCLTVFIKTNSFKKDLPQYANSFT
ncbi:MAG TPA: DNA polymerase V subunit UmuC, partial [Ktedonobacter sp.]|nr:DNA polymerase V subunit UmuC [Ktedonobacter sp.]